MLCLFLRLHLSRNYEESEIDWGDYTLAKPAFRPEIKYDYYNSPQRYSSNIRSAAQRPIRFAKKKKANPVEIFVHIAFALLLFFIVAPNYYDTVTRPIFLRQQKYPAVTVDYDTLYRPTSAYLNNTHFLGKNFLNPVFVKKAQMSPLYEAGTMPVLETKLKNLARLYPTITPSVYVWDYSTGKSASLDSDRIFSAASIIKLPVLLHLFKSIEAGEITLQDKIQMTDYYRSEGSGSLQFRGDRAVYTVDDLARVMITESDNSATNMLMSATGGMGSVNNSLRHWGMFRTRVNDWLPDMAGTNVTTAKELATMLYNIDNSKFLSLKSKEKIVDYMSHVHNDRLIPAGLPSGALFVHKTGDIGKMLGDAGIVYAPNGKNYIVVMLVNRKYNAPEGKDFIVKASSLVYNHLISL